MQEITGWLEEGIGDATGVGYVFPEQRESSKRKAPQFKNLSQRSKRTRDKQASRESSTSTKSTKSSFNNSSKDSTAATNSAMKASTSSATTTSNTSSSKPVAQPQTLTSAEEQKVKFSNRATNRYVPGRKKSPEEKLIGRVRGILNKITSEKFDILSVALIDFIKSKVKTVHELSIVVSLIFTKTTKERTFGPLYADLCLELCDLTFKKGDGSNETSTFRKTLINQCEKEFSNVLQPIDCSHIEDEENRNNAVIQAKLSATNSVEFIGHLYVKELLSNQIIHFVMEQLVTSNATDLQIECAYRLLLTMGKKYDTTDSGRRHLDQLFSTKLSQQQTDLSQRVRILLEIVEDIRRNGWTKPSNLQSDTAKTKAQIRQDFEASKGSALRSTGRGQPTFDELFAEQSNKNYKTLSFALQGGSALRNNFGSEMNQSNEPMPEFIEGFMLESTAVVEDLTEQENVEESDEEEVGNTEPTIVVEPFESEEEREQAKKAYIRDYFNDLEDEKMTKQQSEMKFIKTVRRIGWDDKASLVENILNFVFDMKLEEAQPLGQLFVLLYNSNYINTNDIVGGLNIFCEFYSGSEMDVPMLNIYFAGITLKIIQANIIKVEQIHECFSLDTMIDKKFKKDQIFGRRADYLANLIKLDKNVSCDPMLFLLEDANAEEWRAHYKLPSAI